MQTIRSWAPFPLFDRQRPPTEPSSRRFQACTPVVEPREAGLDAVIQADLPSACFLLLDLLGHPSIDPRKAVRIAHGLLQPLPPAAGSSSTAPQSHPPRTPTVNRPNQTKAAVALCLGLASFGNSFGSSSPDDVACLESNLQTLVGIFVKGGVRAPNLAQDQVVPDGFLRQVLKTGSLEDSRREAWSVWRLSEHLVAEVDQILAPSIDLESNTQLIRTTINLKYLQALFASSSPERDLSITLFADCIRLGCRLEIYGALPTLSAASSSPEDHISSLIWKSRKRLELSGYVSDALMGLPNGGKSFDRWSGGAAEKTRQAEEAHRVEQEQRKRRKDISRGRHSGLYPLRVDDGTGSPESEGEMLAPPLRLKGKKIIHRRLGLYEPSLCSPGSSTTSLSSLGLVTPPPSSTSLRHPDCILYHQSYTQSGPPSPSGSMDAFEFSTGKLLHCREHSTTSLPSLERRRSTDLLRTPLEMPSRRRSSPALRAQPQLASPLKSPTPRPLPTLLNSQAIFAVAGSHLESAFGTARPSLEREEEQIRPSTWLQTIRRSVSTLTLRRQLSVSAMAHSSPIAASPFSTESLFLSDESLPPPLADQPVPALAQSSLASSLSTSLSSESFLALPVQKPISIPSSWKVPSIGITPSSHVAYGALEETAGKGLRKGGVLRSFSPVPSRLNTNLRRRP